MAETFLQRQQRIRGRAQAAPGAASAAPPNPYAEAPGTPSAGPGDTYVPRPPKPTQEAPAPQAQPQATPGAPPPAPPGATAATGANRQPTFAPPTTAGAVPGMALERTTGAPTAATPERTMPAPATQAAAPAASYTPAQIGTWAQSRYGRAPNAQEYQQLSAAVGAPQGPNGQYTQAQYDQGQQVLDQMARAQGWQGPAIAAPAAPGAPAIGPNSMGPAFTGTEAGAPGNTGRILQTPGNAYTANQLSAFQAPNTGTVATQNTQLMQNILANPESLSPSVVAQMKAAGKTSATKQAEQLRQQASTTLAGRGFSGGGGMQAAADAAVDQNFLESLLDSNRNVEIGAAQQNFQDRLAASGAGTQFQNAASQRAIGESGAETQRFGANEGARQAASADALGRSQFAYGQQQADRTANLQEWLARNGVNLDTNKLNEQIRQFNQTFGFDVTRFLDDIRRDNRNFGEGQRQSNNQLGLGYNQLQQQAQNSLLNFLQGNI